jgi:hypothetical protein
MQSLTVGEEPVHLWAWSLRLRGPRIYTTYRDTTPAVPTVAYTVA